MPSQHPFSPYTADLYLIFIPVKVAQQRKPHHLCAAHFKIRMDK
jgi:hypothetical protein